MKRKPRRVYALAPVATAALVSLGFHACAAPAGEPPSTARFVREARDRFGKALFVPYSPEESAVLRMVRDGMGGLDRDDIAFLRGWIERNGPQ